MSCSTSIPKMLGLIGLTLIMLGASWFCAMQPLLEGKITGWIGLVFFGAALLVGVVRLFVPGPVVVLDDVGIVDRRVSSDVILWSDIRCVRIVTYRKHRMLGVELKDLTSFLSRLSSPHRWSARLSERMGFPAVTLGFAGLSPGLDIVWGYLQAHHREKVAPG